MTLITNAFTTYSAKGIREDLSDAIYNISPTETPFMSNAGKGKASNSLFEWQTDSLASAVTNNQQLEGDTLAAASVSATTRLGNYCEIAYKVFAITGTEEVVNKAGRKSEKAYQMAKKSAEMKRDMESSLLANKAANAGGATTARATGSILSFIKTNTDIGASGSDPSYTTLPNTTRTDGTQRAFTETILKNVVQKAWTSGAELSTLMVGATNKQVVSGFSGIATKTYNISGTKSATIIGAADVYVSDFGVLRVVPNRFMRSRDALFLDWDYVSVDYLRPFQTIALAKTGDADSMAILAEYGLRVKNEAALGIAADLS